MKWKTLLNNITLLHGIYRKYLIENRKKKTFKKRTAIIKKNNSMIVEKNGQKSDIKIANTKLPMQFPHLQ